MKRMVYFFAAVAVFILVLSLVIGVNGRCKTADPIMTVSPTYDPAALATVNPLWEAGEDTAHFYSEEETMQMIREQEAAENDAPKETR